MTDRQLMVDERWNPRRRPGNTGTTFHLEGECANYLVYRQTEARSNDSKLEESCGPRMEPLVLASISPRELEVHSDRLRQEEG